MSKVKVFYSFKDVHEVAYRVEVLDGVDCVASEVVGSVTPLVIDYDTKDKLDMVRSSGVTLGMISEVMFALQSLYTDNMQQYVVRVLRADELFWLGYLDSELYEEDFSEFDRYEVSFTGADFNVLDRLKFVDAGDKRYGDIVPLITVLKRCFERLGLPFEKLFIGCTTSPDGVELGVGETALHKLFIQSSNFYDEDNEPMSCREVVEAVLQPFGLMLLQRDGDVYIYDYNALVKGVKFKRYNFSSFVYEGDAVVDCALGAVRFAGTGSTMGFEPLINNVEVTSSLYAALPVIGEDVSKERLSDSTGVVENDMYTKEEFKACVMVGGSGRYVVYTKKESNSTLVGARMPYDYAPAVVAPLFAVKSGAYLIGSDAGYRLSIKADVYVNTKENPFDMNDNTDMDNRLQLGELFCNLYMCDELGNRIAYYDNIGVFSFGWMAIPAGGVPQGMCCLRYCNQMIKDTYIANSWVTNSNLLTAYVGGGFPTSVSELNSGAGLIVSLRSIFTGKMSGRVELEVTNKFNLTNPFLIGGAEDSFHYPKDKVVDILINNFEINIVDDTLTPVNVDDAVFKSYINRRVSADYKGVNLVICSANEDGVPVGRGNLLVRDGAAYALQLSYSRNGKKGCLEELLMGTIFSNYIKSNVKIGADIDFVGNPMMRFGTKFGVLSDRYIQVDGCSIDCGAAITNIDVSEFSADVVNASDIPYE